MSSNYPPGVTGNEPEIVGETITDELYAEASKVADEFGYSLDILDTSTTKVEVQLNFDSKTFTFSEDMSDGQADKYLAEIRDRCIHERARPILLAVLRMISYSMHDVEWNHDHLTANEQGRITARELASVQLLCDLTGVRENPATNYEYAGRNALAELVSRGVPGSWPLDVDGELARDFVLAAREASFRSGSPAFCLGQNGAGEDVLVIYPRKMWTELAKSGDLKELRWRDVHSRLTNVASKICDHADDHADCLILTTPGTEGHKAGNCDPCFLQRRSAFQRIVLDSLSDQRADHGALDELARQTDELRAVETPISETTLVDVLKNLGVKP